MNAVPNPSRAGWGVETPHKLVGATSMASLFDLRVGEPVAYATGSPELKAAGPYLCGFELPDHQRIEGHGFAGAYRKQPPTGNKLTIFQCLQTFGTSVEAARKAQNTRRNVAAMLLARIVALGIITGAVVEAAAQYAPTTPGVTAGGQALFRSVTDVELAETLAMGEYLLIVCKSVPLPRMTAQVSFLREEVVLRFGYNATDAVLPTVRQMLAQNPNINVAACVDSESVDF